MPSRANRFRALIRRNGSLLGASLMYVGERVIASGLSLLVFIVLARTYTPQEYGIWSYTIGIMQFAAAFLVGAAEPMVVRELVARPRDQGAVLGSASCVIAISSLLAIALPLTFLWFTHGESPAIMNIAYLAALSFVPNCFLVLEHYFRALPKPWPITMARFAAVLATGGAKIWMAHSGYSISQIAWVLPFETLIQLAILAAAARSEGGKRPQWKVSVSLVADLARACFPAMVSGVVVTLFFRINYLLIERLADFRQVGFYAFAFNILQLGTTVSSMAMVGIYPRLVELHLRDVQRFRLVISWLFFGASLFGYLAMGLVYIIGPWLIPTLFGAKYATAMPILAVMFLAFVVLASATVRGAVINIESKQKMHLWSALIGLVVLVPSGFALIPTYGSLGAAWAIVVSSLVSGVVTTFIFRSLRQHAIPQLYGLLLVTPFLGGLTTNNRSGYK